MSWLSDRWGQGGIFGATGKAWERNRDDIGHLARNVAPLTALIPGVGVLGAGLIGAVVGAQPYEVFKQVIDAGGQAAPVTYDGTVEKNTMKGKLDIGGMVNGTFTATKK